MFLYNAETVLESRSYCTTLARTAISLEIRTVAVWGARIALSGNMKNEYALSLVTLYTAALIQ